MYMKQLPVNRWELMQNILSVFQQPVMMGMPDKCPYAVLFCCIFNTENNEGISKAVVMKYSIITDF